MIALLLLFTSLAQAEFVGPHCHMKVVKRSNNNTNTTNVGVTNQGKPIFLATSSTSKGEEASMLVLGKGLSASIEMEVSRTQVVDHPPVNPAYPTINEYRIVKLKQALKVTCKNVSFSGMEVEVALENEKTNLATTVWVNAGSPVNLGGIVKDLETKNKNVDIAKGANMETIQEDKSFEYWLEANQ